MEFVDELLSRYVGKVSAMIDPMVANLADAEDLAQEVLVRAGRGRRGRGPLELSAGFLVDGCGRAG